MWSLGHYVIRSLTFSGCQNPHYKYKYIFIFIVSKNDQSKSFLTNDIMTKWQRLRVSVSCLFLIMVDSFLLFSWCGWQSFSWTSWHFTGIVDTFTEKVVFFLKELTTMKNTAVVCLFLNMVDSCLYMSSNVKYSPLHENKSTFIVAMSIIVVPLRQS